MMDFLAGMFGSRLIEIIAAICGLINVTLLVRRSIWNYPFGIVMVTLYAFVFFEAKLYSDTILQFYYLIMQFIGWWWWLKKTDDRGLVVVDRLPSSHRLVWMAIAVSAIFSLGTVMDRFTDAALPYWDATTTVLSVIAQYFLAKRYLENWILWIVVDVLAIGIYLAKGLQPTAVLYAVFLVLASIGLSQWYQSWKSGKPVAS